jgi:hypothetical protein
MVKGFAEFVDFIGMQVQKSENVMNKRIEEALEESEEFVQTVMDVNAIISQ